MQIPESTLEAIANRVAKLEAQNRRLKKVGIASLIVAAAVIAMGQASTKKVIEANEFVLKDTNGETRAWLGMAQTVAQLVIYGPENNKGGFMIIGSGPNGPIISLADGKANQRVNLDLQPGGDPRLIFRDESGSSTAYLAGGGPYLSLSDGEGFQTTIGRTDLLTPRTGESHKTSAASVVLLGKDRTVLWSAP